MRIVDELLNCFASVARRVIMVCVLARFLLAPAFPASPREHLLLLVKIVVLILVEMGLHFLPSLPVTSDKLCLCIESTLPPPSPMFINGSVAMWSAMTSLSPLLIG